MNYEALTNKALVDGPMGAVVEGVAYEVECEEDEARLAAYETNAYETASCLIQLRMRGKAQRNRRSRGRPSGMLEIRRL